MNGHRLALSVAILALASACSTAHRPPGGDTVVPPPSAAPAPEASSKAGPETAAAPAPTAETTTPPPPAAPSAVTAKIAEFRGEIDQLNGKVANDRQELDSIRGQRNQMSNDYFGAVSQINARLQAGTTPGNPELMALWQQAQGTLGNLDQSLTHLQDVSARLSADSAEAGYLANSVRAAFSLEGALDSDHAEMAQMQSQAASTSVLLDRVLADVADDVNRQTDALAVEHRNLPTLLHAVEIGELLGNNLSNYAAGNGPGVRPVAIPRHVEAAHREAPAAAPGPGEAVSAAAEAPAPAAASTQVARLPPPPPATMQRKPQLVVDASQSPAEYEPALYKAASLALARSGNASVEVVAVLPSAGPETSRALATEAARHQAEAVARALITFGVPREHVTSSATQGANLRTGEVWVYTN